MDEVDLQILAELTKDAQMPFLKIARKIGVSPQTVQARYEKMKREGTILHSSITVNLSKLGYQGKVILKIINAPNKTKKETLEALKQIQDVFLATEIIGDFDVLTIAAVKDFEDSINLVNSIRKLPSVDYVKISFTKDTSFPIGKGFNKLLQIKEEESESNRTS